MFSYKLYKVKRLILETRKHEAKNFHQPSSDLINHYEQTSQNTWRLLNLSEEEGINFAEFKFALDLINVIILEGRAKRLFELSGLYKSGYIDIIEFEIILMMNDYISSEIKEAHESSNSEANEKEALILTPIDVFSSFENEDGKITLIEFKECIHVLGYEDVNDEMLSQLFDAEFKLDTDDDTPASMNYETFLKVWCFKIANPFTELHKYDPSLIDDHRNNVLSKVKSFARNNSPFANSQLRSKLHSIIEENDKKLLNAFSVARKKVRTPVKYMFYCKTSVLTLVPCLHSI